MVTRKGTSSTTQQKHRRIVKEIQKKFGKVIDLERSPLVLVEIVREFGPQLSDEDGGGGEGGVSPTSIAVAGPPDPPDPPDEMPEGVVTRLLLTMQKDLKALNRKLDNIATKTK